MDQPHPPPPTGHPGLSGPTGPAGVVAAANTLITDVDDELWAARTPEELLAAHEEIQRLRAHLAAVQASLLTEVSARGIAKTELAWGSTGDWFTHSAGTHRTPGHRAVRQAPVLVEERPATHQALGRGDISPEQAAVIIDALDTLPHDPALRAKAEVVLLEEAGRLDATALATVGKKIAAVVDPDRTDRRLEAQLAAEERTAHRHRFLSITPDGAGGVWLKGRGTLEDAAVIKAALLPLTKPTPATPVNADDEAAPDPRDHGTRLWDALVQACQHTLDTDLAPECHGARPRLAITINLDALREKLHQATLDHHSGHHHGHQVHQQLGGTTEDGVTLSPATLRRLACDADLIPVALDTHGQVLDVGRSNRLVTPALWTALVARDHHCAFPGCTRPPVMCHAHHVTHWADGGPTALGNLVMLCGHHHRTIHDTPWQARLNPNDGHPEFQPPPRHGRQHAWTRHRPRRE